MAEQVDAVVVVNLNELCRVQILTHNFIEILSLDFGVWLKREVGVVSGFSLFVQSFIA